MSLGPASHENFVDRKKELETIVSMFTRDERGAYLVIGERGIGKSSLLLEARYEAEEKGFLTIYVSLPEVPHALYAIKGLTEEMERVLRSLVGPALEVERRVEEPFLTIKDTLRDLLEKFLGKKELTSVSPSLTSVLPLLKGEATVQELTHLLLRGIREISKQLRKRKKQLLVIVDDLQKLVVEERKLLVLLGDQSPTGIFWLLARRPEEVEGSLFTTPEFVYFSRHNRIVNLGKMEVDDLKKIMEQNGIQKFDSSALQVLGVVLGGNPYFVRLCAQFLVRKELKELSVEILKENLPSSLEEIGRLCHEDMYQKLWTFHWVLDAASVLPRDITPEIVAKMTRKGVRETREALIELLNRQIFETRDGEYLFAHDIFREFIYDRLAESERIDYHKKAMDYYLGKKKVKPSLLVIEAVAHHAEKAGRKKEALKNHWEVARVFMQFDLLVTLQRKLGKVIQMAKELGDKKTLLEALSDYIFYAGQIGGEKLREKIEEALELANELKTMKVKAHLYHNLSTYFVLTGGPKEALDNARNALKIWRKLRDKLGMADAYTNIGLVLMDLGQLKEALKSHQKALKIVEELGNKLGMAQVYGNIGNVLAQLDQPKEALKQYQKALKIHEELGNKLGMALDYGSIGLVLMDLGQLKEALKSHQKALKIVEELGNKLGMAQVYGNIGNVLAQLDQPKEALKQYQKALKIHEELGNKLGMANQLGNIGLVLAAHGKPKKALELLETSLKIFKELQASHLIKKTENIIASLKKPKA